MHRARVGRVWERHADAQPPMSRERPLVRHRRGHHRYRVAHVRPVRCAPLTAGSAAIELCYGLTSHHPIRLHMRSRAGVWTRWVAATQCSATCGAGTLTQTRSCYWAFPTTGSILGCQPQCSDAEVAAAVGTTGQCGTLQTQIVECNLRACREDEQL